MFFIVNKTKKHITLSDIGVSLGPRQAIDLDKIMSRDKSERSACLKTAQSKGEIDVRIKEEPKKGTIVSGKHRENHNRTSSKEIESLKKEIKKELQGLSQTIANFKTDGISKEELIEIIKNIPLSNSSVTKEMINKNDFGNENIEVDEEIIADINARTMEKKMQGVDISSVQYKEEEKNNTILNNVDELEGLL